MNYCNESTVERKAIQSATNGTARRDAAQRSAAQRCGKRMAAPRSAAQRKMAGNFGGWLAVLFLLVAACQNDPIKNPEPTPVENPIRPTGPAPEYAPDIDPQMLAVIEQLEKFNSPPIPTLSPVQARKLPTIKDAVEALLKKYHLQPKPANVDISQRVIPGPSREGILVRIYSPKNGTGPFPVVVYYHGGGWVIGSPDVYEPSAKALSEKAGAIVVSVAYRQAPENKFPAAHEDAFAAYRWVRENAAVINGNPAKVAVAGESAGGNLAAGVGILARERGVPVPVHQVLIYPVANNDLNTPSYNTYAAAKPLDRPLVEWFVDKYFNTPADGDNPLISLVDEADLVGLPPTTIIAAQIDPLLTDGQQLAHQLRQAGVTVTYQLYQGVTHEFFGTAAVVDKAGQAQDLAAAQLRNAFK